MPNELEIYRSISDPIWGNIGITKLEDHIINTDAFNRLRQIKQMSMAYIGHMGAQHTRYEHSIGCMHVAYSLARNLTFFSKEDEEVWKEKLFTSTPDEMVFKTIRIAALLHDIGHAPLSHLLESAIDKYPFLIEECKKSDLYKNADEHDRQAVEKYCHETFSVRTLYKDNEIMAYLGTAGINPDIVAYLISGDEPKGSNIPPIYKVYKSLISGDLDADRLDYINRDFYFCGNKQTVDLNLFASALHYGVGRNGQPTIAVDENSVVHAASFLFSRFMLAQTIHNNQDTRINEQAFTDLFRDYLLAFDTNERMQKILDLHTRSIDADLFGELTSFAENNSPEDIAKRYHVKKRLLYTPRALTYGQANKEYMAVYSLSWTYLHPFWRYYLSYIISNKALLSKIEDKLARLLRTQDFVLDFITSRPSKMDLNVYRDDGVSTLINEFNITIPHALMTTAFQSNALYIYSKKEFRKRAFQFKAKEMEGYIHRQVIPKEPPLNVDQAFHLSFLKIVEEVVINQLRASGQLPQEIILLFVMYCLKEYVRTELVHTSTMWIKAESTFQKYLFKHFKESFFSVDQTSFKYNSNIYIMSEKLVCWGLIDHVHKPIHIAGKSDFGPGITKFSTRIDRNINQWGDLLVDYLCENVPFAKAELAKILTRVNETQNLVKDELQVLMKLQLTQKAMNEYMEETYTAEREIKRKNGCVIKFV